MLDQQDGAVRPQAAQKLDDPLRFFGAHPREGLVQKEHARFGREAHGDFERAALAVRECGSRRLAPLAQADDFERARRRLAARTATRRRLVKRPGAWEASLRGEVRVQGRDMTGAKPERVARSGIAYVPEGRGIFPNLSVRENLVMAARAGVRGERAWTLERVLASFPRLGARLKHRGDQLSGGEQQMLSIGRALLTNPDLLMLDEATEGLAPMVAHEIWRVIATLRDAGVASVLVDRNVGAVLAHADRGVILVKGEIVADLPSAELRSRAELLHRHLGV